VHAAAEAEGAQGAEIVAQRVGVPPEDLDGLEGAQGRVELRRMAV